ncbi:hypothetical protein CDIK_2118 [Cucumispora dikerogammari]|nr:hypothetical protein CDIK_2118 [Cucumispora dikerogammari]
MPEKNFFRLSNTRTEIPRPRRFLVSNDDRNRIITKTLERYSVQAISQMYRKNYQTVNSIVKNYLKTGQVLPKKRGGDTRTLLPQHVRNALCEYIDVDCTRTLREMVVWIKKTFDIIVSTTTVNRAVIGFYFTLKRVTNNPERRNCAVTIESRTSYAPAYRLLETENDDKNFVFLDEVGFAVVTRPSRGRSAQGESAYLSVPAARSRNIFVVAAMNKYGIIYHKIQKRAVNGEDFKKRSRK